MSTSLVHHAPLLNYCRGGQIIRWKNLPRWQSLKYRRVWVDVEKLEDNFRDAGLYVGFSGLHGIAGRYEGVDQFLVSGGRLYMPTVCVSTKDARRFVCIYDGRHRFAWLRDHGAKALPVAAPIGDANEVRKLVGSKARICCVTMQDGYRPVRGETVTRLHVTAAVTLLPFHLKRY